MKAGQQHDELAANLVSDALDNEKCQPGLGQW